VHPALAVRHLLHPDNEEVQQDMIRTLALDGGLGDAQRGLEMLKAWKAEWRYFSDYTDAAKAKFPEASVFGDKAKK